MQHVLKCLDIMSRHRHFLLFVAGHGEEKGAVVLGLDFVNHGEVHDVALMGTEEAQGGEEVFYVPEGHLRFYYTIGGVEKGTVRFFRTHQHDFLGGGNHEGFISCLDGYLLGGDLHFPRHRFFPEEGEAVGEPFDGAADAGVGVGLQDVVEGLQVEGLQGKLAVPCGEDDFQRQIHFKDFLGALQPIHHGHFDVQEKDVHIGVGL